MGESKKHKKKLGDSVFASAYPLPLTDQVSHGRFVSESLNLSVPPDFTIMRTDEITVGVQISPFNCCFSRDNTQLVDIKGGCFPTIVHCSFYIVHCWTFTFSAKEKDAETGYSYFGSRYYNSDLSIWLSVDPMSDKYPSMSPYVYCANNPVKLVDPNGEEINPIYDRLGFFLGTDDLGLKGDFIVMERNNFHQNMSHEEALGKSTCFDMYHYSDAKARCLEHFNTLKDRPDYDGKITLEEANEWYRTGNGQPLFADLTKLDLSGFKSSGESAVGNTYQYNLLTNSGSFDDRLVYGNLTFIRTSNDGVRAFADKYDFDMKNWWNPINWGRNIETIIGKGVAGEGKPYTIFLYGTAKLKRAKYAD